MRLLADLHIAPRTVQLLRSLGHDVLRVTDLLLATASDETIVERAAQDERIILTQDLDMTASTSTGWTIHLVPPKKGIKKERLGKPTLSCAQGTRTIGIHSLDYRSGS